MKTFGGSVLFLDRSNINTDEIIPAKYLTETTKDALKPYLLEDLKLDGFDPEGQALKAAKVIITRENFGCGSSREHAPWALEVNDITTVIAQSYARIFRQNMFNCGMLAIELPQKDIDALFAFKSTGNVNIGVSLDKKEITVSEGKKQVASFAFSISEFDEALVKAGGWVEFADEKY